MQAGKLDRKITIQQPTTAADATGEMIETWAEYLTAWAQAIPVRSSERFAAGRDLAFRAYKFRIRFASGITEKMRLLYDSDYFNIVGVAEIGRREGLELTAEYREGIEV